MDTLTAVLIAESADFADSEDQYLEAWQHLVNTGLAWQLQGWFGRTAQAYIDNGYIQPAGMQYAQ
jgi:hypothetical protein